MFWRRTNISVGHILHWNAENVSLLEHAAMTVRRKTTRSQRPTRATFCLPKVKYLYTLCKYAQFMFCFHHTSWYSWESKCSWKRHGETVQRRCETLRQRAKQPILFTWGCRKIWQLSADWRIHNGWDDALSWEGQRRKTQSQEGSTNLSAKSGLASMLRGGWRGIASRPFG